jgi:hypothetical protein
MQKSLSDKDVLGLSEPLAEELVYRLCVAECARLGFSSAYVTKQPKIDADANSYVQICLPPYAKISGYIPHPQTLICVKASYIPLRTLDTHMIPSERLQGFDPARGAAYILASSRQALINSRLSDYQTRMQDCLHAANFSERQWELEFQFYARDSILSWLTKHPVVGAWLDRKYRSTTTKRAVRRIKQPSNVIFSQRLQSLP